MPKNPITDQEIAFAHLILNGTMDDRRAAEAVGLNPDTAADIKVKPCVRAYMLEHAAVKEQPMDQNISRDQILKRLWELATLNPEVTRGSMAGQIKAIAMIVAIEGLIPDRRAQTKPAPSPVPAQIYIAKWRREQQQQCEAAEPAQASAPQEPEPQPTPPPANETPSPNLNPEPLSRVPDAANYTFDTVLNATRSLRLPMSLKKGLFPRGR